MTALFRLGGMLLLTVFGLGLGVLLARQSKGRAQSIHLFVRLLEYMLGEIRYRGTPCTELLRDISQNSDFAKLDLQSCDNFENIPVPPTLKQQYAADLSDCFIRLERAPIQGACAALIRMIALCRAADTAAADKAATAGQLYPKLGFCFGLLVAIALA